MMIYPAVCIDDLKGVVTSQNVLIEGAITHLGLAWANHAGLGRFQSQGIFGKALMG